MTSGLIPFSHGFHSSDRQPFSARSLLASQGPLLLPLTSQQAPSDATLVALTSPMGPLLLLWPLKTIEFPLVFHTFHDIHHVAKKSSKVTPEQPQGHPKAAQVSAREPQMGPAGLQSIHFELLLALRASIFSSFWPTLRGLIRHRVPE